MLNFLGKPYISMRKECHKCFSLPLKYILLKIVCNQTVRSHVTLPYKHNMSSSCELNIRFRTTTMVCDDKH